MRLGLLWSVTWCRERWTY